MYLPGLLVKEFHITGSPLRFGMIWCNFNFQEKYKTSRISFGDSFEVPEFKGELDFDQANVFVRTKVLWVTISRETLLLATCVDVEWMLDSEGFDLEHLPLRDPMLL